MGVAALPAIPGCVTSPASKFVNTLDLKSLYIGEIEGIIDFIGGNARGIAFVTNIYRKQATKLV